MATWLRHIDHFEQKYDKAFVKYPLFGEDLIERIHKCVQVFIHSCNTNSTKDVESGALAEFGGLHKKVERGEWITTTPVWVYRTTPKEDGRQKSDGHGSRSRMSDEGGGRDLEHKIEVDPQLQFMDKLGEMMSASRSKKLCCPMAADVREICLSYHFKGEYISQCMRSHAPLQVYIR